METPPPPKKKNYVKLGFFVWNWDKTYFLALRMGPNWPPNRVMERPANISKPQFNLTGALFNHREKLA